MADVQLWVKPLDLLCEQVQTLEKTLSPDEQERANRFRFPEHRRRFIVARGSLREILGHYLALAPSEVRFRYDLKGKPFLCPRLEKQLQFNVSHSHELALIGVTQSQKIGVDLEYVRTIKDCQQLAQRFFCESEAAILQTLSDPEQAFFQMWTAKEAYLKATGEGIAGGLDQVEVTFSSGQVQGLKSIAGNQKIVNQWQVWSFFPQPDYIATIVVEDEKRSLSFEIFDL